jgi:hypothetical protein
VSGVSSACHFCGGTPTPFLVDLASRCATLRPCEFARWNLVDCCVPCFEKRQASPPAPADPTSPEPQSDEATEWRQW